MRNVLPVIQYGVWMLPVHVMSVKKIRITINCQTAILSRWILTWRDSPTSFDAFTYLMLNKRDYLSEDEKLLFWDQVPLPIISSIIGPIGYTLPYEDNESLFDADYEAFKEVLTELRPQIVIVWNKAIKDCLLSNGDLQFVGMINIPIISTYMFIYEGAEPELSPKQLEKLKKEYNIISEKIETKWLRELLIESFNDPHAVEAFRQKIEYVKCIQGGRSDSNIENIVTLLKRCATQKLIIRMGNKLNFGPGLSRVHKEIFLKLIKESFDAPLKGTNEAFLKCLITNLATAKFQTMQTIIK